MKKKFKKESKVVKPVIQEPQRAKTVDMVDAVCPNQRCRSTKRKHFDGRKYVKDFDSMMREPKLGIQFNRIIYRKSTCLDCGQKMVVRQFTMRPAKG